MRTTVRLQWFHLVDSLDLHLSVSLVCYLRKKIQASYTSRQFDEVVGCSGIYGRFSAKNPRIKVYLLKKILTELHVPLSHASHGIIALGRHRPLSKVVFPYKIAPAWGELLSHAFFDGYADEHSLRYSNYDLDIRREFLCLSKQLSISGISIPKNYKNDITVPEAVPKLLNSIFAVENFYSKECRIPKRLFEMANKNPLFGWYFLKGAFLDEGTLTGGQIWIVRGLANKKLAMDLSDLCDLLGLKTRIQETQKNYGYSVGLRNESYEKFYANVMKLTRFNCKKILKLKDKLHAHHEARARVTKIDSDCRKIINYLNTHPFVQTSQIKKLCGVSDLPALVRLKLLLRTKNIKSVGTGKCTQYILISGELPCELPGVNEVRRSCGWR